MGNAKDAIEITSKDKEMYGKSFGPIGLTIDATLSCLVNDGATSTIKKS